jgi:hypothetical protein
LTSLEKNVRHPGNRNKFKQSSSSRSLRTLHISLMILPLLVALHGLPAHPHHNFGCCGSP